MTKYISGLNPTRSPEIKTLLQQIYGLYDWVCYDDQKVMDSNTVENTLNIVSTQFYNVPVPEVTPNPNCTISLEWESDQGFAHLEIGKTKLSFFLQHKGGDVVLVDGVTYNPPSNLGLIVVKFLFPEIRKHRSK